MQIFKIAPNEAETQKFAAAPHGHASVEIRTSSEVRMLVLTRRGYDLYLSGESSPPAVVDVWTSAIKLPFRTNEAFWVVVANHGESEIHGAYAVHHTEYARLEAVSW